METRPADIDDERLRSAIRDGWGFDAERIEFTPLGFGSYHWTITDHHGERRFVTVDDLDGLARSAQVAFEALTSAFETARTLGERDLDFVVAPQPALDGATVRRLDPRYSVAVFPYVDGRAGSFGDVPDLPHRRALIERLAELHDATESVRSIAPRRDIEPITRAMRTIADAQAQTDRAWVGGPFSEPARLWLVARAPELRQLLAKAADLIERTAQPPESLVVTHGEPHPGNVITTEAGLVLIDWDTVGLAPAERDLWMFANDGQLLAHYAEISGRTPDPDAIALYAAAWTLGDLSVCLDDFRSPHVADEDHVHGWNELERMRWD